MRFSLSKKMAIILGNGFRRVIQAVLATPQNAEGPREILSSPISSAASVRAAVSHNRALNSSRLCRGNAFDQLRENIPLRHHPLPWSKRPFPRSLDSAPRTVPNVKHCNLRRPNSEDDAIGVVPVTVQQMPELLILRGRGAPVRIIPQTKNFLFETPVPFLCGLGRCCADVLIKV